MAKKRTIEVFTAGCPACQETIDLVNRVACPSCDVSILDMNDAGVASRARGLGIRSVPTVVIDGRLARTAARVEARRGDAAGCRPGADVAGQRLAAGP